MSHQVVVFKTHKSLALAIVLTLLFGPLGLFYSTILGGFVMMVLPFFSLLWFLSKFSVLELVRMIFDVNVWSNLILLNFIYWVGCVVWSISGVTDYNRKLDNEIVASKAEWRQVSEIDPRLQERLLKAETTNMSLRFSSPLTPAKKSNTVVSDWMQANPGKSINDYYSNRNRGLTR